MLPYLRFLFLFLTIIMVFTDYSYSQKPRNVTVKDHSVLVEAEGVDGTNPKVILKWQPVDVAEKYIISKMVVGENIWSPFLATLTANTTTWEDTDVIPGVAYEYRVMAYNLVTINESNFTGVDTNVAAYIYGFGYTCGGVRINEYIKGKVLVLVDSTVYNPLGQDLQGVLNDMRAEGWGVLVKLTPRAQTFDGEKVKAVKQIILDEYSKDPDNLKTILLIGRVPVPYSGNFNPDAHPDHKGAWPADVYYGCMNENYWSDAGVNNTTASRAENKNIPGDGKFDPSQIYSGDAVLQVGRVDFYNLPAFKKTELELLKQYFKRNHVYRAGPTKPVNKCTVDDNFGGYYEGFASSGWRLSSLVGKDNMSANDFIGSLETSYNIWAYGCGGGSYSSCGGVGSTSDFTTKKPSGVFTMLFGSYFGDWDSQNNFLRAPLASEPGVLTCAWAGRPQWYNHHMGIGYPIGYSTLVSQNNTNIYVTNMYYPRNYPNGVQFTSSNLGSHVSLLGDPTLRMNINDVPVPKTNSLSATQPYAKPVRLNWDRIFDDIDGYNIYRSYKPEEGDAWVKLNNEPITVTYFEDDIKYNGTVHYLLKAVKTQKTTAGSFHNTGRGVEATVIATSVEKNDLQYSLSCYPNPATTSTSISLSLDKPGFVKLDILDINGNIVRTLLNEYLAQGTHQIGWNLLNKENIEVSSGVYFVKITMIDKTDIMRIIVMP